MAMLPVPKRGGTNKGAGSSMGTAGKGKGKGRMPTPPGRITTTGAKRSASNRKD